MPPSLSTACFATGAIVVAAGAPEIGALTAVAGLAWAAVVRFLPEKF